jgi:uncharacterized membrane protein YjgN (DUF898 family)
VNLALTVITIGVYSAWAKVRRLQYFYRHTRLAGSGLDYHGDPIAILKGRFVGLILLGLYSAIGYVEWRMALLILVTLAAIAPWLIARSLAFRMHNTSYRGIRFRFSGGLRTAYWVFLALPILTMLSLFLAGPFWHHRMKRYQVHHAAYGRTPFEFRAEVGEFFVTYVVAVASFVAFLFLATILIIAIGVGSAMAGTLSPDAPPAVETAGLVLFIALYVPAALAIQALVTARLQNAVWNTTTIAGHRFSCEIRWFRLFGIQLTNLLATVATVGLYRPFAQVRLARYFAGVFSLLPAGPLDTLAAAEAGEVSAVGEEAVGFFDLDIGL